MRYQKIESHIWNDEKFIALTAFQQRLFFYILTSPHNNLLGLYVLKQGYACEDLKSLPKDFQKDLRKLCESGLVRYDWELQVVWIPKFLKHNPITNPNQKKAALKIIGKLPKTFLIKALVSTLSWLTEGLPKGLPEAPKEGLSKPETETETELDTLSGKPDLVDEVVEYLNQILGTKYKPTTKITKTLVEGRQKEGYGFEDFKIVIDKKTKEWKDDKEKAKYLRPETLFHASKFEGYLNQLSSSKKTEDQKRETQLAELKRSVKTKRARTGRPLSTEEIKTAEQLIKKMEGK